MKNIFLDSKSGFDGGAVLKQMENPLAEFETADQATMDRFVESAKSLAQRAYGENESAAKDLVERFLYALNVKSHFGVPFQTVPGLVWGIFMRAKLQLYYRKHGNHGPCDSQTLERKVLEEIERSGPHPFFDKVGKGNKRVDIMFTKNFFHSNSAFEGNLITLLGKAPSPTIGSIIENISDELLGDSTHPDLKARFAKHIGATSSNHFEDPDFVTESYGQVNLRTSLNNLNEPSFALGCFYVLEAIFPPNAAKLYKAWREVGYDDHVLEHWLTHSTVDIHHAEEWLQGIKKSNLTDVQNGFVIDGVQMTFAARLEMFERLNKMF